MQAYSPVDSAVVSGLENDDEEPRDEGGMLGMNILHTHLHTSFTNTCSIMHMTFEICTRTHAHTHTHTCPIKYHAPTHTCIYIAAPPRKKHKKEKKSRVEKAMEKTMDVFLKS